MNEYKKKEWNELHSNSYSTSNPLNASISNSPTHKSAVPAVTFDEIDKADKK